MLALLALFLGLPPCLSAPSSSNMIFQLLRGSQVGDPPPVVSLTPLEIDDGRNVLKFGATTRVDLELTLATSIPAGAKAEIRFSALSLDTVARLAANSFLPTVDVCAELARLTASSAIPVNLPAGCPVLAGTRFKFGHTIGPELWAGVEKWREKVVGTRGTLQLRLWTAEPCTLCWRKPRLLVGVQFPFVIRPGGELPGQEVGVKTEL